jgi:predicted methyltransferase
MDERLKGDRLPNVVLHLSEYAQIGLEGQLDFAFLGNILHDFYYRDGESEALAYLKSIKRALKPGGVLGVTDHVGVDGQKNGGLHRLEVPRARDLLRQAGFVIEAESSLLANPKDDHRLQVYNDSIYRRTDRFVFRARKPL